MIVLRRDRLPRRTPSGGLWTTLTPHFALGRHGTRLLLVHALRPGAVDNDVAVMLTTELFDPGWAGGPDTFERLMTGIVLSCHDDALTSWEGFYRATLARLDHLCAGHSRAISAGAVPTTGAGLTARDGLANGAESSLEGALAAFAPVYRRAEELVREAATRSLLDLGTCFGFFPLRLAIGAVENALSVRATDISPGSCGLLTRMSVRLGVPLPVLVCDAARVPLPDGDVDTVTVLHLLEHVDAAHGQRIMGEAVRLARRRVIIAVPLETEPDTAFGHVRVVSLDDLTRWGATLAAQGQWRALVEEYHGGWLVLDRPPR